jgi:BlaI family transcriptional regulator, penicillinase repressor
MTPRRREPLSEVLGPLEAEVMEVVWDEGEVTVRDVHERLSQRRPVAYTTVMTTLGRLADKGLLRRIEAQPAHRYSPLLSREQYASTTVKSVLDWLVGQFGDPAVAYFVDRLEDEDERLLDSLRDAIEQRRRGHGD